MSAVLFAFGTQSLTLAEAVAGTSSVSSPTPASCSSTREVSRPELRSAWAAVSRTLRLGDLADE